ncbi:NERD domain-containing protein [Thermodesulfobacteriota bacterium]
MTASGSTSTSRPGLWPREVPRHTESEAERKVYNALKASLPKGWYAWHSLKIRTKERGKFSEADFIIAEPTRPGVLILEVKGGQIEQRDGRWHQNGIPLKSTPLDQAFAFRRRLFERFTEKNVKVPTTGVAVCFPDTFSRQQPTQDDMRGLIIGGQDLPYLHNILPDVMQRAVPDPWPTEGPWIKTLHEFWGETWVPKLDLGTKIRFDTEQRTLLDEEQLGRLDEIEENHRVFVRGAAGTGKTLLAREAGHTTGRAGQESSPIVFYERIRPLAKRKDSTSQYHLWRGPSLRSPVAW